MGTVYSVSTTSPCLVPGFHLGIILITRRASLSKSGWMPRITRAFAIANKKKVVKSTYETTARYYQTIGEYKKAIAYIDSATQTDHFQPVNLVPILNAKAGLYYKLNDYKNAYLTLKESNKNRMSDKSQKRKQQMIEMQTRFDVNKLELEKSKLANKNKQIALTGTFILLLAAIGWSIYQRTMVKRLKKFGSFAMKKLSSLLFPCRGLLKNPM